MSKGYVKENGKWKLVDKQEPKVQTQVQAPVRMTVEERLARLEAFYFTHQKEDER